MGLAQHNTPRQKLKLALPWGTPELFPILIMMS